MTKVENLLHKKDKISNKVIFLLEILVIVLFSFNPLISSNFGFFENEFVKLWFVYITACLGWLIIGLILILGEKIPLLPKKIFNILFFFTFIYILASIFGLSFKDSLIGRYGLWIQSLSTLFVLLSIFYFIYLLTIFKKEQFIMYFYTAITSSAILTVLQELLKKEKISIWMFIDEGRITGPFRNPNHFGFYLCLVFVFTLWLSFVNKERFLKFFSFFASLILFLGLILTRSRASWLSAFFTLGITLVIFRKVFKKVFAAKESLIFITVLLVIAAFFLPATSGRVFSIFDTGLRSSYQIRLNEWQTVLKVWQKYPFLGVGPENLDLSYPQFRSKSENLIPEEWKWRILSTRNFWLELLATTGFFGLLGFILFGRVLWQISKKEEKLTPFLSLIIAFYIHSFFYIPATSVKLLFFASAGVIVGNSQTLKDAIQQPLGLLRQRVFGMSILIFIPIMLWILIRVFLSEIYASNALPLISFDRDENKENTIKKLNEALILTKKAYSLNPYFDKNLRQLIFIEEEIIRNADDQTQKKEMSENFISHLTTLEKRNTSDIENLKTLTSGYMRYAGVSGRLREKSIEWGEYLIKIDPTGPGSWDTLGVAYLDAKNYQTALAALNYIIEELKSDYPFAYFHIGETLRQMGKPKEAIPYYQKALDLGFGGAKGEMEEAEKEIVDKEKNK